MDSTRIGIILIKLGAAFMFINLLGDASSFLGYFELVEDRLGLAVVSLTMTVILPAIIIAVLWYFPATIIGKQTPDNTGAPRLDDAAGGILVGVSLVGLYALAFGAVDLFYYETQRWAEASYGGQVSYGEFRPTSGTIAGRYTSVFQIVVGLTLLLGRRGISTILSRARGRGKTAS